MNKHTLAIALSSALLISTASPAMADDNHCNVNLQGNLEYQAAQLTVEMENGSVMRIDEAHRLTINDEQVDLTPDQQRYVTQYYEAIDEAVPMTMSIVSDGLKLANTAVSEVFGEMLGEDDTLVREFSTTMGELQQKIEQKFYTHDGGIRISGDDIQGDGWVDSQWESEFEDSMERLVSQATGRLLMALGSQMLFSEEGVDEFAERMEKFGDDLESRMESQAEKLEEQADELCELLQRADKNENQMQRTIAGLDGLSLLNMDDHKSTMKM